MFVKMESSLLAILVYVVSIPVAAWIAGAIFYDAGNASVIGAILAALWIGLAVSAFVLWHPAWQPFGALVLFFTLFLNWWGSQKPSQHRNWDPHFAQLPRLDIHGDAIEIENVRDVDFQSVQEGTPRFERRSFRFSQLCGIDVLILSWDSPWMCHPMFVFDFGPDGRICISIEVRYRVGQKYSLLRSLYRQQELMYVVCDERDAILRRIAKDGHDLFLYRVYADLLTVRQFFLEYAHRLNELAKQPRWYHGLTTNCTTSIYAQGRGRMQWDWRMLFNGTLDRLMYERGLLDQRLPFDRLKEESWVNKIANDAPSTGFGDYLRQELTGYQCDVDGSGAHAQSGGQLR